MASEYHFFTGLCKWAKLDIPDKDYNYYGINLYLDKPTMKQFKESGLNLKIREDDEGSFVTFRRDPEKLFEGMEEKPKKLIYVEETSSYEPFDELIGNGSLVNCKVQAFDTKRGKGHRLEAVAVEKLIPYKAEGEGQDQDLPF